MFYLIKLKLKKKKEWATVMDYSDLRPMLKSQKARANRKTQKETKSKLTRSNFEGHSLKIDLLIVIRSHNIQAQL